MVSFLLSVCQSESIGFDHKHFAIARWPRCTASRLLAKPKENAPWHEGGSAAGVFPYRSAVDPTFHMTQKPSIRMVSFLLSVCQSEPIGFDHKHFAIARWPRCTASRLLAKPKENAPWHAAGLAGGVFPYRSAVDPKLRMAQNHPIGWFLFAARMLNRSRRQCLKIECRCVIML